MRILLISRTHPLRHQGAFDASSKTPRDGSLESRLHDRVRELSELGHDVLLLTRWTGEAIDFELPSRIEIRAPFKSFQAWEWPKSLPMVFSWRPEVLHIVDPGLSTIERTLSVEMIAMTMLETLRRSAKGRTTYKGGLVSHASHHTNETKDDTWARAGASIVESDWLRPAGAERALRPWDGGIGRNLRFVVAGEIGKEAPLSLVLQCLEAMRALDGFEVSVFLNRADLSSSERQILAHAERQTAFGTAVGSRLHLLSDRSSQDFDAALVTNLDLHVARAWVEHLEMPVVLSEPLASLADELRRRTMHAQVFGHLVTELASAAQGFAQLLNRDALANAWSEIEQGALAGGRDVAANHVSRLYSQIARTSSPS